jgi:hypothetical protein
MTEAQRQVLIDAHAMIRNELEYVKTGKHPGGVAGKMRDNVGQWKSLCRDLQNILLQP